VVTLPRGRALSKKAGRTTTHVVDYRHVIGSLRAKPGALAGFSYRDALSPRPAYLRAWEALSGQSARDASRTIVGLLALAHDQGVEADLASALDDILDTGDLPDLADLRVRFMPPSRIIPSVHIEMPGPDSYDRLLMTSGMEMAA
jgi:hypothetical protein